MAARSMSVLVGRCARLSTSGGWRHPHTLQDARGLKLNERGGDGGTPQGTPRAQRRSSDMEAPLLPPSGGSRADGPAYGDAAAWPQSSEGQGGAAPEAHAGQQQHGDPHGHLWRLARRNVGAPLLPRRPLLRLCLCARPAGMHTLLLPPPSPCLSPMSFNLPIQHSTPGTTAHPPTLAPPPPRPVVPRGRTRGRGRRQPPIHCAQPHRDGPPASPILAPHRRGAAETGGQRRCGGRPCEDQGWGGVGVRVAVGLGWWGGGQGWLRGRLPCCVSCCGAPPCPASLRCSTAPDPMLEPRCNPCGNVPSPPCTPVCGHADGQGAGYRRGAAHPGKPGGDRGAWCVGAPPFWRQGGGVVCADERARHCRNAWQRRTVCACSPAWWPPSLTRRRHSRPASPRPAGMLAPPSDAKALFHMLTSSWLAVLLLGLPLGMWAGMTGGNPTFVFVSVRSDEGSGGMGDAGEGGLVRQQAAHPAASCTSPWHARVCTTATDAPSPPAPLTPTELPGPHPPGALPGRGGGGGGRAAGGGGEGTQPAAHQSKALASPAASIPLTIPRLPPLWCATAR